MPEILHDKIFTTWHRGTKAEQRISANSRGGGWELAPSMCASTPQGAHSPHALGPRPACVDHQWCLQDALWAFSLPLALPVWGPVTLYKPLPKEIPAQVETEGLTLTRRDTPPLTRRTRQTSLQLLCRLGWWWWWPRHPPGHLHWGQVLRLWAGLCTGFWKMEGWEPHQIQRKCLTFTGSYLTFLWALFSLRLHD